MTATDMSESRCCEVCGDPIHRDNKYGICRNKPECARLRDRRRRALAQAEKPAPQPRHCEVCDSPLASRNQSGICSNHDNPECMRERKRRDAAARGVKAHRITVKAGDVYNRWAVLEDYSLGNTQILARCECGTERHVNVYRLIHGRITSCGCSRRKPWANKAPYLTAGTVFGRLTVLEDVPRFDDRALCRCECGTEKKVHSLGLKHGHIRSCGCLALETRSRLKGFSKHPLYPTWNGILDRCTLPNHPSWHNYGGRVDVRITICDHWRNDPWAFAEDIYREIGQRPEGKDQSGRALYELDRKDNNGGYWCGRCPECVSLQHPFNVQWSTKSQQRLNQRNVFAMTQDTSRLVRENEALAARVAELEALLADCTCGKSALSRGVLF